MAEEPERSDYSLHTTKELRDAVRTAKREESRVREEDSEEALEAERTQRRAMEDELRRRQRSTSRRLRGPVSAARSVASLGLVGTATAFAFGAAAAERAAELVRPGPGERPDSAPRGTAERPDSAPRETAERRRRDVAGEQEPDTDSDEPVTPPPAQGRAPGAGERGPTRTPPTVDLPDGPAHERASESHVAALADGTADEVAERVPRLSTDELRALQEYEKAHRNRRTVLEAIERSAASAARDSSG